MLQTYSNLEFIERGFKIKILNIGLDPSASFSRKICFVVNVGRMNPNTKYKNLDDNFFKDVKTEEKAYLLGWIASDGSVRKSGVIISINKRDQKCLEILKNIICPDLIIKNESEEMIRLTINSKTISEDVCKLLNIVPGKKFDIVNFPDLESDFLKWSFLRGLFDGDGSIHNISETHGSPLCKITSSSQRMRKSIVEFTKIPCGEGDIELSWYGNNALDFLGKIYNNSKYRLQRKYEQYLDISTWVPSVSYSRYYKNKHCSWSKTRKDAISPSKERVSDSGYDLVLLEKIKTVGKVEFYDTGIKIKPNFGYYFILAPRSSISKTGYMLANSIGIIDRTYIGNIIVALIKIDDTTPDLVLPNRLVQIIPTPIVHLNSRKLKILILMIPKEVLADSEVQT